MTCHTPGSRDEPSYRTMSHSLTQRIMDHNKMAMVLVLEVVCKSTMRACLVAQSCPTLGSHGLRPTRLLCLWDSPDRNTGGGCHALLQGIFLTQESNPCLLHCKRILLHWAIREAPIVSSSSSQLHVTWMLEISQEQSHHRSQHTLQIRA